MAERGAFLQSGSYSAEDFRQAANGLWLPEGVSGSIKRRGGVVPASGADLAVSENGTPNMSVNVAAGRAVVPGGTASTQGAYTYLNDSTKNLTITAAHATLPRKDLVVLRVQDAAYAGSINSVALEVVTGTAAASPSEPAIPTSSIVLAMIDVPAGDTAIGNAQITDRRTYTVATGGILPVANAAARTAIASPYLGQHVIEADTKREYVYDGTAWKSGSPLTILRARLNASTAISAATWTAITTNWVVDEGPALTGGYQYSVPEAGLYQVIVNTAWANGTASNHRHTQIAVGGVRSGPRATSQILASGDGMTTQLTRLERYAAGNLINPQFYGAEATTVAGSAASADGATTFQVLRIGD